LLALLVAGVSGFIIAERLPATYQAQAKVLVGPVTADRDILAASSSLVRTYAELASSDPVRQAALDAIGLQVSADSIEDDVQVRSDGETRILTVQVHGQTPQLVADLANEIAEQLREVDTAVPRLPEGRLTIVEPATVPAERFGPLPPQVAVLSGVAGLIAAVLLVIAVDLLSDTIGGREDVPRAVRLLGVVSNRRRAHLRSPRPVDDAPDSNAAVLYHVLANRMTREAGERPLSMVVVGITRLDGADEVAVNLALALRQQGKRVRLVDADASRHAVDAVLGGARSLPGDLVQYDLSKRGAKRIVRRGALRGLARGVVNGGYEPLFARMQVNTDIFIVVPPALASSATAWMWAQFADGAIVVVQTEQTSRRALDKALASAGQAAANVLGIVLRETVPEDRRTSVAPPNVSPEPAATDLGQSPEQQPDA
jgi:capsular polysaccharide biosynthesis protein